MNKKILFPAVLMISLFGFMGCAQLVVRDFKPKKGGVVKYNTGWFMAEKNRAKALELAAEHCRPKRVSILSEEDRLEATGNSSTHGQVSGSSYNSRTTQEKESSVYIKFSCN